MVKSEAVLDRTLVGNTIVTYSQPDMDQPSVEVTIPRSTYDWMREPEQITVTIEPGDRLNS